MPGTSLELGPTAAPIRLAVEPGPEALGRRVAARLLGALRDRARGLSQRPLGLATGRTMEPVYAALRDDLAALPGAERRELLAHWHSFNLDEYVGLGPADPRSFAATMAAAVGEPLGLAPAQLCLPDGLAADPEVEAQRYAAAIAAAGGLGLQLLGLGSNGHVGFNEPPCGPEAPCRRVELAPATRRQNAADFGGDPEAVPRWAISLGLAEILQAEELLLVVSGGAKAEILRRALLEPPTAAVPASWLQRHPRLRVMVDAAAAAELSRGS